ncbi:MAG: sulfurtransferase TusA family protein [Candidatus Omnitrophica bacterium]|nr:sulfurtransferase TusA family protein [Candidatus Omnitrophota bacterium]
MRADVHLDLRGVRCPLNYIKTRLALEALAGGQALEVIVDDGDAVRGIPAGLGDEGHEILATEPADPGHHRIVIRKNAGIPSFP